MVFSIFKWIPLTSLSQVMTVVPGILSQEMSLDAGMTELFVSLATSSFALSSSSATSSLFSSIATFSDSDRLLSYLGSLTFAN